VRYAGDLDRLRREWADTLLELRFATASAALTAAADLVARGVETDVGDSGTLRCRLPDREHVGALLAGLGEALPQLRRVRELPVPLRDLIAHIYSHRRDG
jgi:ABC-2 type transport system ATP-binding protein